MIWSITISSILTDFSPQCKDCTCSDTRTRCSSQNSFHSYSFQELVNCNFTRETKHETPLRELFTGKSLSAESMADLNKIRIFHGIHKKSGAGLVTGNLFCLNCSSSHFCILHFLPVSGRWGLWKLSLQCINLKHSCVSGIEWDGIYSGYTLWQWQLTIKSFKLWHLW